MQNLSRRDFLKAFGVAAGVVVVANTPAAAFFQPGTILDAPCVLTDADVARLWVAISNHMPQRSHPRYSDAIEALRAVGWFTGRLSAPLTGPEYGPETRRITTGRPEMNIRPQLPGRLNNGRPRKL